jgi:hypothetical protein
LPWVELNIFQKIFIELQRVIQNVYTINNMGCVYIFTKKSNVKHQYAIAHQSTVPYNDANTAGK